MFKITGEITVIILLTSTLISNARSEFKYIIPKLIYIYFFLLYSEVLLIEFCFVNLINIMFRKSAFILDLMISIRNLGKMY